MVNKAEKKLQSYILAKSNMRAVCPAVFCSPWLLSAADADIKVETQTGHKRLLKTLLMPPLLPLPSLHHHHGMQPFTTTAVSSSASSDDGDGNTVSITVGDDDGSSMSVRSVTCSARQQDLYIPGK